MDVAAVPSAGDKKHCFGKKKGRRGRRRPHHGKSAAQGTTMQAEDKCPPKKTGARERGRAWTTQQVERRRDASPHFTCCRGSEYQAKDLERHFEEKHGGSAPLFSCHSCPFETQQFSCLQIHLLSHKDTFSCCSICNDHVERTWPELSAHLSLDHCHNGQFSCQACRPFSTADVKVFLEHMWTHDGLGLEGARRDLPPPAKDKSKAGPNAAAALRCQHCDYRAPRKWSLTRHVRAAHLLPGGKEQRPGAPAVRPKEPQSRPPLTRSAVKEMCWLTQDCLTLPGRDFLDKYCHLADPHATLQQTQRFLMKSVGGEGGGPTWSQALKSVWSNVPQDVNVRPKSESGGASDSSDLAVLTVKNQITLAQNGATYAKRLGMMTVSDKDGLFRRRAARDAVVHSRPGSESAERLPAQTQTNVRAEVSASTRSPVPGSERLRENRENHKLRSHRDVQMGEAEPPQEDVVNVSCELKMTKESRTETLSVRRVLPKRKRPRRKRQSKYRRACKTASGLPLKIVLKKNPVKETQWVSQSSLEGEPMDPGVPACHETSERTGTTCPPLSQNDASQSVRGVAAEPHFERPGPEPAPHCSSDPAVSRDVDEMETGGPEASTHLAVGDEVETSGRISGVLPTPETGAAAEMEVKTRPSKAEHQSGAGDVEGLETGRETGPAAGRETPDPDSPSASQLLITPQGVATTVDQKDAQRRKGHGSEVEVVDEAPADSDLPRSDGGGRPAEARARQERRARSGGWRPVLKQRERTLKLVAVSPSQPVKRPAGRQPVVVLNHPDAELPEVARIMEVVNRYRGEVQKVVLSRRTLGALAALDGNGPPREESPAGPQESRVQERFLLRLRLRRLSGRKYQVVDASPSREAARTFRCWFCGRAFAARDAWTEHRRRHLMEWMGPGGENS